mmetsp:Transcript_4487/g.10429  ORF Transcript_4487/g.10429 Transcript_4487/m.10429 type:complete len:620 (+) Transcript_4487:114-1973(+)
MTVVYYRTDESIIKSAFKFKKTTFPVVVSRFEFWIFLFLHATTVGVFYIIDLDIDAVGELPWECAETVQFFMTFFITFYNRHCYSRYHYLYRGCMDIIDSALLFMLELSVSLNNRELEQHRVLSAKYVLAAVFSFFMGLTGGDLERKEWKELVFKGLLTNTEMDALMDYPGGKVIQVLLNWAMQVVDDALKHDVLWSDRSERIAHVYNRLHVHTVDLFLASQEVSHLVALPIPFPYFHLMNLVLMLNFLLVGMVLALFKNLFTIVPYTLILLFFLGLRQVATELADPFGEDEVDFPVAEFLNYLFDHSVCLLEAFGRMDAKHLFKEVEGHMGFSEDHVKTPIDKDVLYKHAGLAENKHFHWTEASLVKHFEQDDKVLASIRRVLRPKRDQSIPTIRLAEYHAKAFAEIEVLKRALTDVYDEIDQHQKIVDEEEDLLAQIQDVAGEEAEAMARLHGPTRRGSIERLEQRMDREDELAERRFNSIAGRDQAAPDLASLAVSESVISEMSPRMLRNMSEPEVSSANFLASPLQSAALEFEVTQSRIRHSLETVSRPGREGTLGSSGNRNSSPAASVQMEDVKLSELLGRLDLPASGRPSSPVPTSRLSPGRSSYHDETPIDI